MADNTEYLEPIHPGEILLTEYLEPLGLSQNRLARELGVPPRRINEIVHGQRAITADTAIRLGLFFGTSPQFWLNLQSRYELDCLLYSERTREEKEFASIRPFAAQMAAK